MWGVCTETAKGLIKLQKWTWRGQLPNGKVDNFAASASFWRLRVSFSDSASSRRLFASTSWRARVRAECRVSSSSLRIFSNSIRRYTSSITLRGVLEPDVERAPFETSKSIDEREMDGVVGVDAMRRLAQSTTSCVLPLLELVSSSRIVRNSAQNRERSRPMSLFSASAEASSRSRASKSSSRVGRSAGLIRAMDRSIIDRGGRPVHEARKR
jgi:hypothetical protein